MAQLHGTPVGELSTRPRNQERGRIGRVDNDSEFSADTKRRGRKGYKRNMKSDDEQGGHGVSRSERHASMLSACRDRSTSAWLYFPHIELMFLLFAFEGAVAAGVAALRESRCPWVIVVAAASLVSEPDRCCEHHACYTMFVVFIFFDFVCVSPEANRIVSRVTTLCLIGDSSVSFIAPTLLPRFG